VKSSTERRRSRLVLERGFQYRFALRVCLLAGAVFLVLGGTLLFFIKMNYDMLREDALIQMPDMVEPLAREFRLVTIGTITSLLLMTGLLFALGLFLSQRIAGPLMALRRRLRDFGDGKTGVRLRLRSDDDFRNLEEVFNASMEAYDRRIDGVRERLLATADDLDSAKLGEWAEKLRGLRRELDPMDPKRSGTPSAF